MRYLLFITLSLSLLQASGCGGKSSNNDTNKTTLKTTESAASKYTGIWFSKANEIYLEIDKKGSLTLYTCAFTEGYKTNGNIIGTIKGDTLTPSAKGESPSELQLSSDKNSFSYTEKGEKRSFIKTNEIPSVCTGNGIKITHFSPKLAVEGQPTKFIIALTHQLKTTSDAVIKIGFTNSDDGSFKLIDGERPIGKQNLSVSGWIVTTTPLIFSNKTPFKLHAIILTVDAKGVESRQSIASDEMTIQVTPKP